ncbi:hypothetical protein [Rhabdochlamydiaceae symbiont of Dictyostelium giganteum]|uniref:hypothetical protein n=1 Tax=Rhabdochlamydiaceae symbiont of Dictyostelium giganteum TaxID=3342349 RepID=UPI00384CB99B
MVVPASSSAILFKTTLNDLPPFVTFELDLKGGACSLQYAWRRDASFIYTIFKDCVKTASWFGTLGMGAGGLITAGTKFVLNKLDAQPLAIKNKIYTDLKKQGQILWNRAESRILFPDNAYLKAVLTGAGIGAVGGFAFGMLYGSHRMIKVSIARQQALQKSHQESAKAQAILKLFLENKAEALDWECPISQEIMAFPVATNCGHVFEFFALSLMMQNSPLNAPNNLHPCPLCNTSIYQISREQQKIKPITENAHIIFNKLEQILVRSHLIDGLNADEIKISVEKGQTFINRPIEELAGYLAGNETLLSREELFALAAYILSQFNRFHYNVRQVYYLSSDTLNRLQTEKKISIENAEMIRKSLQDWYEKREFIPQNCTLARKFYNAL